MPSYLLVVRVLKDFETRVGSLGEVKFKKGHYIYVGSAKPGISRVCRHFKREKKLRWHIDYLTTASFASAVCAYLFECEECFLSEMLAERYECVEGFGCSDCKCKSHLYYSKNFPVFRAQVILPSDCERFL